jgi:beta-glucosidase
MTFGPWVRKLRRMQVVGMMAALSLAVVGDLLAQQSEPDVSSLPYRNPQLSVEERVDYLLKQLTVDEKVSQLANQSRAVPRLGIPAYDWWSESLHGVAVNGTTEFPEPIGLAATFDPALVYEMGVAISTEARVLHARDVREGHSNIYEGLDFWAPNINIFRDPRWGRGQETYGEDPYLTGRMGVAFVTGMQGDDEKYYRVIATPKHFAVHSGPESTRHLADVQVSKHDELDTYLPAFRAAVVEGKAGSVMCAYNSLNGQPACVNQFLLEDQLRGKWGFKGYVVSDCGAVIDVHEGHQFTNTQPEASALAIQRGMDNECVDWFAKVKDDHDYKPYAEAVKLGLLKESEIDASLRRLYTARIKLGMFDPPEMVPYSKIDEGELDSAAHRRLARKMANESMVLLKNDGVLPLKAATKIAVIGPLADQTKVLLGNYNGTPTHSVSVLDGIKAEFPSARVQFEAGTQFLRNDGKLIDAKYLSTVDGRPGLEGHYGNGQVMGDKPVPVVSRVDATINLSTETLPAEAAQTKPLLVEWDGFLTPDRTGDYNLGIIADGYGQVLVNGKQVAQEWMTSQPEEALGRVHLEAGKKVSLKVVYGPMGKSSVHAQLVWVPVNRAPSAASLAAAKDADVIVAVVGITSQLEGEEMPVNEDGFKGGDRTSLDLPKPEQDLLEAVAAAAPGKPMVVVLMNGSALSVNWAQQHANAILEAWYSGEEGGTAVAETLSGKNNPGGRLPLTFYKDASQLPPFDDYSMKGRTYRYFEGTPLYRFGYGLSYTTFRYSDLKVPNEAMKAGEPVVAEVKVTNAGSVAGDEVVELYLNFPDVKGAPLKALRGMKRIHLDAGASDTLRFELKDRDLSMVTENGDPLIAEGKYTVSIGGGQPGSGVAGATGTFSIQGSVKLPE